MLTVSDLMMKTPYTTEPSATLREVLMLMKVEDYRQVPVVDDDKKIIGIITERDIRLAMNSPMLSGEKWLDDMTLDNVRVRECMTKSPITIRSTLPAYEAADMLRVYKFGALPVVDDDKLVGILSVTDFLTHFVVSQREEEM